MRQVMILKDKPRICWKKKVKYNINVLIYSEGEGHIDETIMLNTFPCSKNIKSLSYKILEFNYSNLF